MAQIRPTSAREVLWPRRHSLTDRQEGRGSPRLSHRQLAEQAREYYTSIARLVRLAMVTQTHSDNVRNWFRVAHPKAHAKAPTFRPAGPHESG